MDFLLSCNSTIGILPGAFPFCGKPATQDETEIANLQLKRWKGNMIRSITLIVSSALVGFTVLYFTLLPMISAGEVKKDNIETIIIVSIAIAALTTAISAIMDWLHIGESASCRLLARNRTHKVLGRIDMEDATYLLVKHWGLPRFFEFKPQLAQEFAQGAVFNIGKKFDGCIGRDLDGKHFINLLVSASTAGNDTPAKSIAGIAISLPRKSLINL